MRRKGGSGRPRKVGDQIQRELSELIRRELRDPRIGMVTLTGVEMSPDCAHATVYYTCLDADRVGQAGAGLRAASGFLRSHVGARIKLHATPELHFAYDESVARGDHLSRLIDSVTRDDAKG